MTKFWLFFFIRELFSKGNTKCCFLQTHLIKACIFQYVFDNVPCRKIMIISCRKLSPVSEYLCRYSLLPVTGLLTEKHFYVLWVTVFKLTTPSPYLEKSTGREIHQHASHGELGPCHLKGGSVELVCPTGLKKYFISHFLGLHCYNSQLNVRHSEASTHEIWHSILKYWICLFCAVKLMNTKIPIRAQNIRGSNIYFFLNFNDFWSLIETLICYNYYKGLHFSIKYCKLTPDTQACQL